MAFIGWQISNPNRRSIGGIVLFFGGFFVLLALQEGCYKKAERLQATVIDKAHRQGSGSVGRGNLSSGSSHNVKYRFTRPDGEIREHWAKVLPGTYRALNLGDPVEIEYLAATADSRLPGQVASGRTFLMIAAALIGLGLYLRRLA